MKYRIGLISLIGVVAIAACNHVSPFDTPNDHLSKPEPDQVWVEIMPAQCLSNPWQQEWLADHGIGADQYPRDREQEVLRAFLRKRGVDFFEYREEWVADAVCLACSCPEGYAAFLKINATDLPVFLQLGFSLSGANLSLEIDKPEFRTGEIIRFRLSNPSAYTFVANGKDGFGGDELLVARGSDFTVQRWQNGYWQSVELPLAIEGTSRFDIEPAGEFRGHWFNHQRLAGRFRILLIVHPKSDSTQIGHVISEAFTITDSLVPFDPEPHALEFGDPYEIRAGSILLQGDTLGFEISHAGGCRVHDYAVNFHRVENLTAYIFIHHNASGDACEAYLRRKLRSNLQLLLVKDDFSNLVLITAGGDSISVL